MFTFPHRAVQTGTAERLRPWGPGFLPAGSVQDPVPPTGKQGSLTPLWRPRLPSAPAKLGRIREGPVERTFGPAAPDLTLELKEPPPGSAFWLPRGPRPAQEESRVCVW